MSCSPLTFLLCVGCVGDQIVPWTRGVPVRHHITTIEELDGKLSMFNETIRAHGEGHTLAISPSITTHTLRVLRGLNMSRGNVVVAGARAHVVDALVHLAAFVSDMAVTRLPSTAAGFIADMRALYRVAGCKNTPVGWREACLALPPVLMSSAADGVVCGDGTLSPCIREYYFTDQMTCKSSATNQLQCLRRYTLECHNKGAMALQNGVWGN